jgi:integrase
MTALKAMLAKAVEWDLLEAHPLTKIKPLKVDKHSRTRYLKPAEETALREALDTRDRKLKQERASANAWRRQRGYTVRPEFAGFADHMKPMVLVSINTGIRRGELFQLRWADVDLKQRVLTVRGTTAKAAITRHVPLNQEAVDVLTTWKGRDANPLVFPGRDGEPFNNVKKAWAGVLNAAKVKAFRWHDLRHSFASKLVMAGVDLNTVRELLGHSDLKMTLRYAHLAPEHKADAVAKLVQS